MGYAEIAWRVRQAIAARLESFGVGQCTPVAPSGTTGRPWVSPLPMTFDPTPYRAAADRIVEGCYDIFAMRDVQLGFPPPWTVDPKTGTYAPMRFGKAIDYRDERIVGDVKYLWEVNRQLELVTLAQAWHLTGDGRYANACRTLLESWLASNPYPDGPNWTSSLEHGYRLVNWAVAWHLLGGDRSQLFEGETGTAFRLRWLASVRQHCHFIAGYFSRYSSANNHLLGEYCGLFIGAVTWPLWPESARWRQIARMGLDKEFLLQTAEDGVNREQAIHYQRSVMDLMLLSMLFGRANGAPLSSEVEDRFASMVGFIAALSDRNGQVPSIGDSDDAMLVRWDPRSDFQPNRSLRATGALLCPDLESADTTAVRSDDKTRWLLGDGAVEATPRREPSSARPGLRRAFPIGGYYVLEARRGDPDEVLAVFDCGPIGYPAIAAHGHADALSLTIAAGGVPMLVDPGTYAYHTGKAWRNYFRSTRGHNTVVIDDLDQSVSGGNFLWLAKANCRCIDASLHSPVQFVVGEHDGYRRLSDPVIHRRRVEFHSSGHSFTVVDEVVCKSTHSVQICWHFSESCLVTTHGRRIAARSGGVALMLETPVEAGALTLTTGGADGRIGGWTSPSYDVLRPSTTAVWSASVNGSARFETKIDISFNR